MIDQKNLCEKLSSEKLCDKPVGIGTCFIFISQWGCQACDSFEALETGVTSMDHVLLFSLNPVFHSHLESYYSNARSKGQIKHEFERNGIPLTDDAEVSRNGDEWNILDYRRSGPRPEIQNSVKTINGQLGVYGIMEEEYVKSKTEGFLRLKGFEIISSYGNERFIDIVARKDDIEWRIECKGDTKNPSADFNTAIGQIMGRMSGVDATYSVALPYTQQYKKQALKISPVAMQKLGLQWIWVGNSDMRLGSKEANG